MRLAPALPIFALTAFWLAYAVWVASGAALAHPVANDLAFMVLPWCATVALATAARRSTLSLEVRQAWRWLAVATAINATSALLWLVADFQQPVLSLSPW